MLSAKGYAKVVQLDKARFMVLGGSNLGVLSKQTENYDARTNKFTQGPELPVHIAKHCAVKVNQTHMLIAGGQTNIAEESEAAWLVNMEQGTYEKLPNMDTSRVSPVCTLTNSGEVICWWGN